MKDRTPTGSEGASTARADRRSPGRERRDVPLGVQPLVRHVLGGAAPTRLSSHGVGAEQTGDRVTRRLSSDRDDRVRTARTADSAASAIPSRPLGRNDDRLAFTPMALCEICSRDIRPGARFCAGCGNPVAVEAAPSTPAQSASSHPTVPPTPVPPVQAPASEPTVQTPGTPGPSSEPTVQVPQAAPIRPPQPTGAPTPLRATAPAPAPTSAESYRSDVPPSGDGTATYGFLADPKKRNIAIGVGVVLVLGIGALIGILLGHSHSTTTSTTPELPTMTTTRPTTPQTVTTTTLSQSALELTQAQQVESIAQQSASARSNLGDAVSTITNCGDIQTAVTTLTSDASTRTSLMRVVNSLNATAIPGGPAMVADLQQALQASAASDQNYAAWGSGIASSGGCTGTAPQDTNWSSAQQTDTQATTAKNAFVSAWNPIATTLGLATFQANQL